VEVEVVVVVVKMVVAAAAVLRSIPKLLKPNISNVSINDVIK
jgi:hypothetical protein